MIRLFVQTPVLQQNTFFSIPEAQTHYLSHVMRKNKGDLVAVFNGSHGLWEAEITAQKKKEIELTCIRLLQSQPPKKENTLYMAAIKKMDIVIQKATELGIDKIVPVITQHCAVRAVNGTRLNQIAIEAAEQSERMSVPKIEEAISFDTFLKTASTEIPLIVLSERSGGQSVPRPHNAAFLVGPEGGFSAGEIQALFQRKNTTPICLGQHILRAETAAIAILSCYFYPVFK